MTDTDLIPLTSIVSAVAGIADDRDRARAAHVLLGDLQASATETSRIRREAIAALLDNGSSKVAIGDLLGVSRQRVGQILNEGPAPEQALLAPQPGPVTICVVEKIEAERGHAAITRTTMQAARHLTSLAESYERDADITPIPATGMIDLNRDNLVVLIGPRSSMLVAQAISADPVIRWRPDKNGDWYIVDTNSGKEYHSDFDAGRDSGSPETRTCYAHIGRIRRPDGNGSWLCLAGAHAPGVAGAVALFCRDITHLWEQARKALWAAIVQVTVTGDGSIQGTRLVTPVYVHPARR